MGNLVLGLIASVLLIFGVACSDDDDGATDAPSNGAGQNGAASSDESPAPGGSGDAGALMLGDEVFEITSARCFLEEQDVAGSAGKILFTAQGLGTNPSGEDFILDVSRYDEESQFTGDDITVDIGNPTAEDFYSWRAAAELGTIELDGSNLSASGLTFRHSEDASEVMGSFEISC